MRIILFYLCLAPLMQYVSVSEAGRLQYRKVTMITTHKQSHIAGTLYTSEVKNSCHNAQGGINKESRFKSDAQLRA